MGNRKPILPLTTFQTDTTYQPAFHSNMLTMSPPPLWTPSPPYHSEHYCVDTLNQVCISYHSKVCWLTQCIRENGRFPGNLHDAKWAHLPKFRSPGRPTMRGRGPLCKPVAWSGVRWGWSVYHHECPGLNVLDLCVVFIYYYYYLIFCTSNVIDRFQSSNSLGEIVMLLVHLKMFFQMYTFFYVFHSLKQL